MGRKIIKNKSHERLTRTMGSIASCNAFGEFVKSLKDVRADAVADLVRVTGDLQMVGKAQGVVDMLDDLLENMTNREAQRKKYEKKE